DPVCAWLRLSGIVRRSDGLLKVRNTIYRQVFNDIWIRKNRKVNWARAALIAASVALGVLVLVAAALAPFAYLQRNEAISDLNVAVALQLAAKAQLTMQQPSSVERAALLGAESLQLSPTAEADQVVRTAID